MCSNLFIIMMMKTQTPVVVKPKDANPTGEGRNSERSNKFVRKPPNQLGFSVKNTIQKTSFFQTLSLLVIEHLPSYSQYKSPTGTITYLYVHNRPTDSQPEPHIRS